MIGYSHQASNQRPAASAAPVRWGLPFLGVLPALRRDILAILSAVAREQGDVVRLAVPGRRRLFLVSHPDHVRHVLQERHANYRRTPLHDRLKPVLGEGLVTSDGELWQRQRRLLQPAFHSRRIRAFVSIMTAATVELARRWQRRDSKTVDISREMSTLALTILARALLIDRAHDPAEIATAVQVLQELLTARFLSLIPFADRLPTTANRRFAQAVATLDAAVAHIINARTEGEATGELLLDRLLSARDPDTGARMRKRQVRDEVMTMFLAGHETSAAALAWTWHLLAQHPAVMERVRAEVATVLAGAMPEPYHLDQLVFTRMVLQEVMRLYPPAPWFSRLAAEPDRMGGYTVPADAIVLVSPWVIQRDPRFWPEPEHFDPQRFAPTGARSRPAYAYFPFGGGPRTCIGNHFAMTEMLVVVALLAPMFEFRRVETSPAAVRAFVTLRPAEPLRLQIKPRGSTIRPGQACVAI